jgi:hypothetical protein
MRRERRCVMSEAGAHGTGSSGTTLERDREEVLAAARPLPPDEEAVIADLTEEEDRLFIEAIMGA